jgi:hypothetical protein
MGAAVRLTGEQREFLSLVTRAAFSNPFTDEFDALQLRIAGCDAAVPSDERVKLTVQRWNERLHELHAAGLTSIRQVADEDREVFRYACLYEIYHRHLNAFDELIA